MSTMWEHQTNFKVLKD